MANAAQNNRQQFPQVAGFVDLLRESGLSPSVAMVQDKQTLKTLGRDPYRERLLAERDSLLVEIAKHQDEAAALRPLVKMHIKAAVTRLPEVLWDLHAAKLELDRVRARLSGGQNSHGTLVAPCERFIYATSGAKN